MKAKFKGIVPWKKSKFRGHWVFKTVFFQRNKNIPPLDLIQYMHWVALCFQGSSEHTACMF